MEEMIASGQADLVGMARQILCDPYTPQKALSGRADEITKCCRCFTCFGAFLTTRTAKCAFNPVIGRELDHEYEFPKTTPKKVLIAGGGPGGMEAALTAKARGHEVILFEKSSRLGGQLLYEEHVPFKSDLYAYAVKQAERVMTSGADVRLGQELTAELVGEIKPDVLICAVGASQLVPKIPGIDSPKVKTLDALHSKTPELGKKVVILGGGLVGSETAVYLDSLGHDVTVVEMRGDFAVDAAEMHKTGIELELRANRVKLLMNTTARAVTDAGLLCADKDGKEFLVEADSVLLAAGMRPNVDTVLSLRDGADKYFAVGDCVKPGKVYDAVANAYYGALDI
jgi:pyruvate/2-oxoglutarate dehydrogenase complex dihydrolipoamide dehydrogenase (E3) component